MFLATSLKDLLLLVESSILSEETMVQQMMKSEWLEI
jgi:hypothetical protein